MCAYLMNHHFAKIEFSVTVAVWIMHNLRLCLNMWVERTMVVFTCQEGIVSVFFSYSSLATSCRLVSVSVSVSMCISFAEKGLLFELLLVIVVENARLDHEHPGHTDEGYEQDDGLDCALP